jgi:hypothetical protein
MGRSRRSETLSSQRTKRDGSMLHPHGNTAGNNLNVIPSGKASNESTLETAQRLSRHRQEDGGQIAALMRLVIGIAGFMLAIVSPTIASAATIEEVAHCRAIPQLAERLYCFKSLKLGRRPKSEDGELAKKQNAPQANGSSKMKNAARPEVKQAAPARMDEAPAKTEQTAPAKAERAVPPTLEEAAPAKVEEAAPAKTEQVAPSNTDEVAPANTETTTKSNVGESLLSPTPEDPSTTSSIDRLSVAGQPLCADAEALAAMLLAGLLTSDLKNAATHGCQILPDDAKLKRLERLPSVFPFIRIVRVRVTSPTRPDLTLGFTIETGR